MISVCLASYNGEKYIKEQIESILQQLSVNDELIVSDDGSTDHTLSIIAEIGDPRIKIYFHKSEVNDLGCYSRSHYLVTRNFECALSVALGDYIFWLIRMMFGNRIRCRLLLLLCKNINW